MTEYPANQFKIPQQPEIIPELSDTPDRPVEDALRAALAEASDMPRQLDPTDVDTQRMEFGAATVHSIQRVQVAPAETSTHEYNELLSIGKGVVAMRSAEVNRAA